MHPSAHGRTPDISDEIQTSAQAWKLIGKDYTLRLSLLANEWATEHLKAWNEVFAEGRRRGNSAYPGFALVEMEIADADKRADWAYQTCCEIWEIQGRAKSRPFFRAIFEALLQPMFSIREGCFRHQLELHQKRTGARFPQGLSAILGHMKREMAMLRAKWNTKLEIATRDNEYRQQRIGRENPPGGGLTELMARGAPECAILPPLEQLENGGSKSRLGRPKKRAAQSKTQLHKTSVIFGAIQSGLKAQRYCAALDERRVRLPDRWIEEGCPSIYAQAYRDAKWRKRIQDEKCRYREQYEDTPTREREAIIQGQSRTRGTRH